MLRCPCRCKTGNTVPPSRSSTLTPYRRLSSMRQLVKQTDHQMRRHSKVPQTCWAYLCFPPLPPPLRPLSSSRDMDCSQPIIQSEKPQYFRSVDIDIIQPSCKWAAQVWEQQRNAQHEPDCVHLHLSQQAAGLRSVATAHINSSNNNNKIISS